jgi:aspartate racemase
MKIIGLLGTEFTMEQDFYRSRLESHGLSVLIPPEQDRDIMHHIISEELYLGDVRESSRKEFLRIITQLNERGAEGMIEGCTEIVMLLKQEHTDIPLFDTTEIHARQAVAEALN